MSAALQPLVGKTLAQIAAARGISPEEAAIELVIADHGRVDMVYQTMSEANLRQVLALPFTSVGSDAEAMAPEGEIGRAHVRTTVTNAHLVCRLLLAKKKITQHSTDVKQ